MLFRSAIAFGSVIALTACAPRAEGPASKVAPAVAVAAASFEPAAPLLDEALAFPTVEMESSWQGFGVPNCSYLAPKGDFVAEDGSVDVIFHFHAGQMSDREMRESGVRGVFVSCGYGIGTTGYANAFEDPSRFGRMTKALTRTIGKSVRRDDVHLRRLALVSWSAGYAAVSRILAAPAWYAATDTVVLLDSLHARYIDRPSAGLREGPGRGAEQVNTKVLQHFVRFAKDAAEGKKTMVITHSSIVPPDYASTTEATAALLFEIDAIPTPALPTDEPWGLPSMSISLRADEGGLHVRGFRGTGPRDHVDHLHLIGIALRSWLVPRWYTPGGERP